MSGQAGGHGNGGCPLIAYKQKNMTQNKHLDNLLTLGHQQASLHGSRSNAAFNTYKEGLDLEVLRRYCMEHGEVRTFLRGETLEDAGSPAQWVAFVERGCFKYMVHRSATKETLGSSKNDEEGKDYCTGFAFEGEFVADFPYCLDGDVSEVSIEADMPCEVRIISGQELQALFDNDPKLAKMDVKILKNLFKMVYGRDLDHYRYTARSRYRRLIDRCPQVVQTLSLKDIASFLNITPSYLSKLRKEMTYETRAEGKRACTMPRKKE